MTSTPEETPEGTPERPALRIGNPERESAMKALDEHLAVGRLDVQEYADRSAAAAEAKVVDDLNKLFADLPYPHPDLSAIAPVPATQQSKIEKSGDAPMAPTTTRGQLARGTPLRIALMACVPIAAVALCVLTGSWWWFLLVPLAGALIYPNVRGGD